MLRQLSSSPLLRSCPHNPIFFSPCFYTNRLFKGYATISPDHNSEDPIPWPTISHPTPYEIFHITKGSVDKKTIKGKFHKLAKIYHPDSAHTSPLGISPEIKAERFKKIVAAYDILKDDKKRKEFDMYNKGWEDSPRSTMKNFYGRDFSRATHIRRTSDPEDEAWAGYHEDYRERMKHQDPAYQKSEWEKHKRMVGYMLLGSFLVGAVQFFFLMRRAEGDITMRNQHSQKTYHDVYLALTNYGFGFGKQERINRFLAHREDSLYDNINDKGENKARSSPFSLSPAQPKKEENNDNIETNPTTTTPASQTINK